MWREKEPLTRLAELVNMPLLICISEEENMKIGERGQVTIPKDVRERYGLLPNIEVEFVPEESGVLLRKRARRASPVEKVYGILKRKSKTDDIIEALRGR
jgi:AbrB family looped-hinge helix DNA binding protein